MDYAPLINALVILTTQIVTMIMKDDTLTEEEKKEFMSRITLAQDSIQEWK